MHVCVRVCDAAATAAANIRVPLTKKKSMYSGLTASVELIADPDPFLLLL